MLAARRLCAPAMKVCLDASICSSTSSTVRLRRDCDSGRLVSSTRIGLLEGDVTIAAPGARYS